MQDEKPTDIPKHFTCFNPYERYHKANFPTGTLVIESGNPVLRYYITRYKGRIKRFECYSRRISSKKA